jgi:pilus assembly protein Flp/PilA
MGGAIVSLKRGINKMRDLLFKKYFKINAFLVQEEGQDLVEYALVVALIAFGAVAALQGLSTQLNTAFATISSDLVTSL